MVVGVAAASRGAAGELVVGVGGVVGGVGCPWYWMGEFHIFQCSAFQSG